MRRRWKDFLAGFLAAVLMLGMGVPSLAATVRQLNASYNNIKITLDGQLISTRDANGAPVDPFIVDGTTYLPVRAVSDALGLGVEWDTGTQTVKLTRGGNGAATTAPGTSSGGNGSVQTTPVPSGTYNRTSPAPIGTIQSIHVETYSENYNASVVVLESIRGQAAYDMLQKANSVWNSAPKDGMEYIVVKVRVSINSVSADKAIDLNEYDFDTYSSDNVEYDRLYFTVSPDPQFSGNVFAGGTLEGYMTVQVKTTDPAPKIVFGSKYDGSGGIWFRV